ncbi:hypothetical protein [Ulvibacterium sp.]|uniref:hypothetical protein n=1 Tax=Ulvibacterium sp. TaxID=2665914 RepID=UPI0026311778|nr:hypothetical protein [Ulvibacterium sp.]
MKRLICGLIAVVFILFGCASKKESKAGLPFQLGQVYAQRWIVEENLEEVGYDVIIPIRSLDTKRATLQKLYHRGQVVDVKIKLQKIGAVAVAEYPMNILKEAAATGNDGSWNTGPGVFNGPSLPFELTGTQAALTYLEGGKIKYFKIEYIRQNPIMSYPSLPFRNFE